MAEVAKVAGVSHQTVSRVVNGFPGVGPQTRERIEAAIIQTGYRRNSAARTLVTRKSGLIGVITVGSFLYGPTSTLAAIDEAAREHGYSILLSSVQEGEATTFQRAIGSCLDRTVEAIVVIAARKATVDHLEELDLDVPMVVVGPASRDLPNLNCLSVNQAQGARLAVEHLVELGHRDIALLTGPASWMDARERLEGARQACEEAGLVPRVYEGDWSAADGYKYGNNLAQNVQKMPTAIFAANDHMALGLIAAFHANDIKLPEQVSLVGFDDVPEAAYYSPALTPVPQDFPPLVRKVLAATLTLL
ncbi:LacI family DNA-binding transcriptional regulator, partial [Ancrocorticia populi]|uniref:LacI family DNA-binding transcriptional regulator n=1 Tax=Ancrocorticia populi TaxID=2175228 RepID=UPI003F9CCE2A